MVTSSHAASGGRSPWRRAAGVAGPLAFIGAWATLGHDRTGYSPVDDPISRLAAVDASSRWAMTAGFLAYGAGVSVYSAELRARFPGRTAAAAVTNAVATVGIAATPLGSALGGNAHAGCAGLAYLSLAAMPVLGGRSLARQGRHGAAALSIATGLASGACLLASIVLPDATGLLQRTGLTLGDAWIVATALWPSSVDRR